jgi:hypothetical protein
MNSLTLTRQNENLRIRARRDSSAAAIIAAIVWLRTGSSRLNVPRKRSTSVGQRRTTKEIGGSVLIYVLTLPFLKT